MIPLSYETTRTLNTPRQRKESGNDGGWRSLFQRFPVLRAPSFPVLVLGRGVGPVCDFFWRFAFPTFSLDLLYAGSILTSTPHKTVDKLVLL